MWGFRRITSVQWGWGDWFCVYLTASWSPGWLFWRTHMLSPSLAVDIYIIPFVGIRIGCWRIKRRY